LKEKSLGEVGRDWATSDAFEALVRKENSGIGQVWLDGQSVSYQSTHFVDTPDGPAESPDNHNSGLTIIRNHLLPLLPYLDTTPAIQTINPVPLPHEQFLGPILPLPRRTFFPLTDIERE
jgi:hypothetical protein